MSPIFGRSDLSTTSLITWWSTFLIFQSWTLSASHVFCRRTLWAKWKRSACPAEVWSPLQCVPGWLIATCSASLWDGMIIMVGSWWYINILQGTSLCKYIHFTPHIYRDLYVAITLFDYPIYACLQRNSLLVRLSSPDEACCMGMVDSLPDEACWEHAEKEQNMHDGDGWPGVCEYIMLCWLPLGVFGVPWACFGVPLDSETLNPKPSTLNPKA